MSPSSPSEETVALVCDRHGMQSDIHLETAQVIQNGTSKRGQLNRWNASSVETNGIFVEKQDKEHENEKKIQQNNPID